MTGWKQNKDVYKRSEWCVTPGGALFIMFKCLKIIFNI